MCLIRLNRSNTGGAPIPRQPVISGDAVPTVLSTPKFPGKKRIENRNEGHMKTKLTPTQLKNIDRLTATLEKLSNQTFDEGSAIDREIYGLLFKLQSLRNAAVGA